MPNIADINGQFTPLKYGVTSVEDRGYQFSDAAYEVITFINRNGIDEALHLKRLFHTLKELDIPSPISRQALILRMQSLLEINKTKNALIYIQISRGIAPRSHIIPKKLKPFMVMSVKRFTPEKLYAQSKQKITLKTLPDWRHGRCDLKTISLLPNILSIKTAREDGFDDVLFINHEEHITEGSSWNFWWVCNKDILHTYPLDHHILHGITRQHILTLAKSLGYEIREEKSSLSDILQAKEAFITSASRFAQPVHRINDFILNQETPICDHLNSAYIQKHGQVNG